MKNCKQKLKISRIGQTPGLGPINKILRKIPQNFHLILRFLKKVLISKYPIQDTLNFVQLATPTFVKKNFRFFRENWKIQILRIFSENLLIGPILWQKIWKFWCSYLKKLWGFFPRNFDRNTFSKNLGNFQKFENLVKILRIFFENFIDRTKPWAR